MRVFSYSILWISMSLTLCNLSTLNITTTVGVVLHCDIYFKNQRGLCRISANAHWSWGALDTPGFPSSLYLLYIVSTNSPVWSLSSSCRKGTGTHSDSLCSALPKATARSSAQDSLPPLAHRAWWEGACSLQPKLLTGFTPTQPQWHFLRLWFPHFLLSCLFLILTIDLWFQWNWPSASIEDKEIQVWKRMHKRETVKW